MLDLGDHFASKEVVDKPKKAIAILDCGPMMNDCNKLQDGGDYF